MSALTRLAAQFVGLKETALRFPLPLASALAFCATSIATSHNLLNSDYGELMRLQVFFFLGVFLSLAMGLFTDSRRWSPWIGLALGLVALALLAWQMIGLPPLETVLFSSVLSSLGPGFVLLACTAAFLTPGGKGEQFWHFNRKAWQSAAFGLLVAVILAAGLAMALTALETLFGLRIPGYVYSDIWIFALGAVWPLQTLSGLPKDFTPPAGDLVPRWARHLISYLLVPLALAYFVILYAYMVKTLLAWSLPQGEIGYLVAGYAGFGSLVFVLAWPLRLSGPVWLRLFCRFFSLALLLPAGLLLLAIWLRIEGYGLTEARYLVAAFGLWLLAAGLCWSLWPRARLVFLPLTLALVLILSSFGPWGAVALSTKSQLTRFETALSEAGRIADGKASANEAPISRDLQREVSSLADYFVAQGKQGALVPLLADTDLDFTAELDAETLLAALAIDYLEPWMTRGREFFYDLRQPGELSVAGYSVLQRVSLPIFEDADEPTPTYGLTFDEAENRLDVDTGDGGKLSFDLLTPLTELVEGKRKATDGPIVLEVESGRHRARLMIEHLAGLDAAEKLSLLSMTGSLLVGENPK